MTSRRLTSVFTAVGPHFGQIGIVVEDLDRALDAHAHWGPFHIYTYSPETTTDLRRDGVPARFSMVIAINQAMPVIEFVQPLDDSSQYADWLAVRGSGLHHLGFYVPDCERATMLMARAGYESFMSGRGFGKDGSGAFAYFDTRDTLGYLVEAIEKPVMRREPERIVGA